MHFESAGAVIEWRLKRRMAFFATDYWLDKRRGISWFVECNGLVGMGDRAEQINAVKSTTEKRPHVAS